MLLVSLDIEDEFLVSFFVAQHPNSMIQTNAQWFEHPPIPKCSDLCVHERLTRLRKRKKQLSWAELSRRAEMSCEENPLHLPSCAYHIRYETRAGRREGCASFRVRQLLTNIIFLF